MENLEKITTPEELFEFLKTHMKFGVVDKNGKKWTNCSSEKFNQICNSDWRMRSAEEILASGVGQCYDFVEVERFWFEKHGFAVKTFWVCAYRKNVENSGFAHSFLAFKQGKNWFHFEVSDAQNQGLHKFNNLASLKSAAKAHQIAFAEVSTLAATSRAASFVQQKHSAAPDFSTILTEFSTPPLGLNIFEYVNFVCG